MNPNSAIILAAALWLLGPTGSFAADDELTLEGKVRFVVAETARIEDFNEDPKFQRLRREVMEAGDARYPVLKDILLDTKDVRVAIAAVLLMQGSGPKWERYGDERNELFRQILYDEIAVVDNDDSVKVRAASALRFSGGVEEARWLLPLFGGDSEPVTATVVEVLAEIGNAEIADDLEKLLQERAAGMTPEEIERDHVLYIAPAALAKMRARGVGEPSAQSENQPARQQDGKGEVQQSIAEEATAVPAAAPEGEIAQPRLSRYWPYLLGGVAALLAGFLVFARSRRS